jgi:hypothetical protein
MGKVEYLPLRKALATNSAAAAFTAKTPTTTKPSGDGVFDVLGEYGWASGVHGPSHMQIIPFGTDANDETFDMRVWGWSKTRDATPIWVPQMLLDLTITLGNIAATDVGASHFLADTIVVNEGPAAGDAWYSLITTADDTPASILMHLRGCELIEFDWDAVTAASVNCFFRMMSECS